MTSPVAMPSLTRRCRDAAILHAGRLRIVLIHTSPWIFILPGIVAASTIGDSYPIFWPAAGPTYFTQIGAWILGAAFVTAATCWVLRGDFFHRWLAYLTGVLLCRALQLSGSELWAAVAVTGLIWYASAHFEQMRHYLQQRLVVSLLVGGLVCQCLPLLVPHDLWAPFAQLGIWRYRIYVATMLSGRSMILLAVIGSEVMSRAGWITACEPSRLTVDSAAFNPAPHLPEPRRAA